MESIFYKAAKFNNEVGRILIGKKNQNILYIENDHDGYETDLGKIHLNDGESLVGFWHSHHGIGTFLSEIDKKKFIP